ncbi:MAG: excinuclease ABC subunit UvrC [Deltaproteobacteria bacterium]
MSSEPSGGLLPALQDKLDRLPASPGVYLMKDREGRVVYVGKAVSLRSRVRSYFNRTGDSRAFIPLLDGLLGDIEILLTSNEKEALILENTLIKKHKPRFNVMLRDDKSFICLRLDGRSAYPRLEIVRAKGQKEDGASYFGPYSSASSIRETLRVVNRHFQLRTCTDREMAGRSRPCLEHQLGRCPAPCVFDVPRERYAESVREVGLFLSGKADQLTGELTGRMQGAAAGERFEEAARLRDQLRAVERSLERQRVVQAERIEEDVFGVAREGPHLAVALLLVRQGRLVESRAFDFTKQEFPTDELLGSFVSLYYDRATPPRELLLPLPIEGADSLAALLSEKAGRQVGVLVPQRGEKRRLVEMACQNAEQALRARAKKGADLDETLSRLVHRLNLTRSPRRIECYDISNFQGTEVVGSKVAFRDGEPDKGNYRRYRIRSFSGQDDFAALYEVLSRRLGKGKVEGDLPDLLVIDGGKGQLEVAMAALRDQGVSGVDVISLAKSRLVEGEAGKGDGATHSPERVFLPGVKEPVVLRQNSSEIFILQRLRDEAHRFAIGYHRKLRDRRTLRSALDAIAGIGPSRRRALLRRFGSLQGVRAAEPAEIAAMPGFGPELAERVLGALKAGGSPPDRPDA